MHPEAYEFIKEAVEPWKYGVNVIEFGSRDINGTPRDAFTEPREYVGVDIEPGPGVEIVGDAADPHKWIGQLQGFLNLYGGFDVAICAEVFEHTPKWPQICQTAWSLLEDAGVFVTTCATDPRAPHSAVDGFDLRPGEYYANVGRTTLAHTLEKIGFQIMDIKTHPRGDLYASAVKLDKDA